MKFYFAAPFEYAEHLIPLVAHIHGKTKHVVTSTWLMLKTDEVAKTGMQAADYALTDLHDLDKADICVLFNPEGFPQSPGRNIEFGYALAKGKALWIVGRPKGVFQYLPHITQFDNSIQFQNFLDSWNDASVAPYYRT